jgi:hypothetical protein
MFGRNDAPVVVAAPRRSRFGTVMFGALAVVALLMVVGKLGLGDFLPSLPNPFSSKTVDRSQPALLKSLEDLSRYEAASANLQVIVDTEKDAKFLPQVIKGERTVYVAAGDVMATVDFSALDERSIVASEDRRSVTITLPQPVFSAPHLDPKASQVVSRQRGLLDRLGSVFTDSPTSERTLQLAAEGKMAAAANDSDLRSRAETNTRQMLVNMLRSLGYGNVTVNFAPNPA